MHLFARLTIILGTITTVLTCHAHADEPPKQEVARQQALCRSLVRMVADGYGNLLRDDIGSRLPPALHEWFGNRQGALSGADRSPFQDCPPWGEVTQKESRLFLHVVNWPDSGKMLIPRLHNSVRSVKLGGEELKLTPNVHDWQIALPKEKPGDYLPMVTVELDAAPLPAKETPPVVKPQDDGRLVLHSRYAITHGKMLRFEPQPHKNTVGYWVEQGDWAEWSLMSPSAGQYEVELRYGCGNGQGGSTIELSAAGEKLDFQVEATGGFQTWRDVKLGSIRLPAGTSNFRVKPTEKAKNAVMDIQQIILTPK